MTDGTLRAAGATLYYKARGSGPLLLLLPGGDSTADAADGLADHLVAHYTVLTYDRRGLSRSVVDDGAAEVTIPTHAEDVHRLVRALRPEPVIVVGNRSARSSAWNNSRGTVMQFRVGAVFAERV